MGPVGVDDHAVIAADALFLTQIRPEPGVKEGCFGSEAAIKGGVHVRIVTRQGHFTDCRDSAGGANNSDRGGDFDGVDLHTLPERILYFFQKANQGLALSGQESVVA